MRCKTRGLVCTIMGLGILICASGVVAQSPETVAKLMRIAEIYDVAVSGRTVWAVGSHGVIFRSPDLGETWEVQDSGTKNELFSVWAGENGEVWVVGRFGMILHTKDEGKHWEVQQKETPETKANLFKVFFVTNQVGWAAGEWGSVFHTQDGGKSWVMQRLVSEDTAGADYAERSMSSDVGQTADMELTDEEFSMSSEEAQEDELVSANDRFMYALHFVDSHVGWVVGEKGVIGHTEDGGKTWVLQKSPAGKKSLFGVYFKDSMTGWACGMDGAIIFTNDGGSTWYGSEIVPLKESLYGITMTGDGVLWAVGRKGVLMVSKDQGKTWTVNMGSPPPVNQWLIDVEWKDNNLIIAGGKGTMFISPDSGKTWR